MITKLLKSLISRKFFLILVCICYTLSFTAFCYVYSYQKQQISDASEYRVIVQMKNEAVSLSQGKDIALKLKNENYNGFFIFLLDNGNGVIYDNDTSFLGAPSISDEREILVQNDKIGKIGDDIDIDGEEYNIIGYSASKIISLNIVFHIDKIPNDMPIVGMMYYEKTLPSETLTANIKAQFQSIRENVEITATPPVDLVKLVVENQMFLILGSLLLMSVLIAFIINIYFFQIRSKFVKLAISFGVKKYKLLLALIIEQAIIIFPMILLGCGAFSLLYLIIGGGIIIKLGIFDFILLGALYYLAMIFVIGLNFAFKLRRNYV